MSKYLRIYETLCPSDRITSDDPRRGAITTEMRAVCNAATDADAARVIEWWDVWPNEQHATAEEFCREARRLLEQTQESNHGR